MRLLIQREKLLPALQVVVGVVEKKHKAPILSNILLSVKDTQLSLTASNFDIELTSKIELDDSFPPSEMTLPARKLMDICRMLPEGSLLTIEGDGSKALLISEKVKFSLLTLPPDEFPCMDELPCEFEQTIQENDFYYLLQSTVYAMGEQNVRLYLNGIVFVFEKGKVSAASTDGHRMASVELESSIDLTKQQFIIPAKTVLELIRLLDSESNQAIQVSFSSNYMKVLTQQFFLISKLIEGRYPDYKRVIPLSRDKKICLDKLVLKSALQRVAILSNENYKGVRIQLSDNILRIVANNPNHEIAEEELAIKYDKEAIDIGFNVAYLLDVLNSLPDGEVVLYFTSSNSGVLVQSEVDQNRMNVIMPMRL